VGTARSVASLKFEKSAVCTHDEKPFQTNFQKHLFGP